MLKHTLKLFKEFSTMTLAKFDAETRFRAQTLRGDSKRGIELLDKIDKERARNNLVNF